jgi:hypothetical protein
MGIDINALGNLENLIFIILGGALFQDHEQASFLILEISIWDGETI